MVSIQGCAGSIDDDSNHWYMRWPAGPVRFATLFQTVQVSYAMLDSILCAAGRYSCAADTVLIWHQRSMQRHSPKRLYNAHSATWLMCRSMTASRDKDCLAFRALTLPTRRNKSNFWYCVVQSGAKCGPEFGADLDLIFESRFWRRWIYLYFMNVNHGMWPFKLWILVNHQLLRVLIELLRKTSTNL